MDRKPARKITNHGREMVTGGFASYKNKRIVKWESQIERDFLYLLEFDESVESYYSQAIKLEFLYNDKPSAHYPDIEVTRKDGSVDYYEVKPFDKTDNDEFRTKAKVIADHLKRLGHGYKVVTDRDIRIEPALSNYKILFRYLWVEIEPDDEKFILKLIEPNTPIFDVRHLLEAEGFDITFCYALMAKRKIKFDMNKPIDFHLPVSSAS